MLKYYRIFLNLFAVTVIIFLSVELFYLIVRTQLTGIHAQETMVSQVQDVTRDERPRPDHYRAIVTRDLFGAAQDIRAAGEAASIEALQPTSLKLALLGTVWGNQESAVAVIEETSKKKQALYKVGDRVQGALVKGILRGKVILRVEDRDEVLTIEEATATRTSKEPSTPKPTLGGDSIVVSRADVEESIKNVHQLLSQVRIRPFFSSRH